MRLLVSRLDRVRVAIFDSAVSAVNMGDSRMNSIIALSFLGLLMAFGVVSAVSSQGTWERAHKVIHNDCVAHVQQPSWSDADKSELCRFLGK